MPKTSCHRCVIQPLIESVHGWQGLANESSFRKRCSCRGWEGMLPYASTTWSDRNQNFEKPMNKALFTVNLADKRIRQVTHLDVYLGKPFQKSNFVWMFVWSSFRFLKMQKRGLASSECFFHLAQLLLTDLRKYPCEMGGRIDQMSRSGTRNKKTGRHILLWLGAPWPWHWLAPRAPRWRRIDINLSQLTSHEFQRVLMLFSDDEFKK